MNGVMLYCVIGCKIKIIGLNNAVDVVTGLISNRNILIQHKFSLSIDYLFHSVNMIDDSCT